MRSEPNRDQKRLAYKGSMADMRIGKAALLQGRPFSLLGNPGLCGSPLGAPQLRFAAHSGGRCLGFSRAYYFAFYVVYRTLY